MRHSIICLFVAIIFCSCAPDKVNPGNRYTFERPSNFPAPVYTFNNNPVTGEGFELGRALFYDPVLSGDSSVSCANCHQQTRAFSDPVHRFSKGVDDASGFRNAPAIQNTAFQEHFFWDGGVNHLDFVPINAITSELEMKETLDRVISKLKAMPTYRHRFTAAFGSDDINSQRMLFALSQFMNMMVSAGSPYDRYTRGDKSALTSQAQEGLRLFERLCSGCHATDLFTDGSFRNNGLAPSSINDLGRERITGSTSDRHKFKVPSLRNVALTSPYMHDGRFKTLDEVIAHYRSGIVDSETLDPQLRQDGLTQLIMSDEQQAAIVAFLETLTDRDFILDNRFTNPFIQGL